MTGVVTVEVGAEDDDQRLDRWFKRHYPDLGHGRLQKMLRTGQVRLDGKRTKANARLLAGQSIRVPPMPAPDANRKAPKIREQPVSEGALEELRKRILHQDKDVLAIDKPAGLAVQGGSKTKYHLDGMLDGLQFDAEERPRLVHRLDKDTSGVLLLGRSRKATTALTAAFRSHDTRKFYLALIAGNPKPSQGQIDLALSKKPGKFGESMAPNQIDGKRAITRYQVLENAGRKVSLVLMEPLTGRTHQLRVHSAFMETPILGDGKYGGPEAFPAGTDIAKGLYLHAWAIKLPHPRSGTLTVCAPPPKKFLSAVKYFGFDPQSFADPELYFELREMI
jgi:23S rRNA pseudouridine955/2504/2580 synthase